MRYWRLLIFALAALTLNGCNIGAFPFTTPTSQRTPIPAPTTAVPIEAPDPLITGRAYLEAWQREDYKEMYAMLTSVSQDAIDEERFTRIYNTVATEAGLWAPTEDSSFMQFEILSSLKTTPTAQIGYRVHLFSRMVGEIRRDTHMSLTYENNAWRIQWDNALILPELAGGNRLFMEYRLPARGNIYDRQGKALVAQSAAVAVGLNAPALPVESEDQLLELLEEMSGGQIRPDSIRPRITSYRNAGWYLPIADFSTEILTHYEEELRNIPGVILRPFRSRYYFDGGSVSIAPHITGYMSAITPEEEEYYRRLGYKRDERVGRSGLESWGEQYLAGTRGASLYVLNSGGAIITKLADVTTVPSQSIYTTFDKEFQDQVQQTLKGYKGAVVVLERDSGRILAMASSPGFNPNLFEPSNYNSESLLETLYNQNNPLLNRATQGQYPLGSVFKIITMAAALESNSFTPTSEYNCGYLFTEISGVTLHDWTYERFLVDRRTQPSGRLTLPGGLTKSCNPFFWHIGVRLYDQGLTTAVSDMARSFGLGSRTGFELNEAAGLISEPKSQIDAANYSIGQGETLVTPLQVARFIAAVGNGGVLYQPQVVENISLPSGEPTYSFNPTVSGTLNVSPENLEVIQAALVAVIGPQGTARSVGAYLNSYNINAAGKTGTAQTGDGPPHAWFAGYTFAEREGQPDIAVAVILESAGEGSEMAAPIFQGVVKLYFYGPPRNTFPWETEPGVPIRTGSDNNDE
jgi:penicillin-binding protein 2